MKHFINGNWKSVRNTNLNIEADEFTYKLRKVGDDLFILGMNGDKPENMGFAHSNSYEVGSIIDVKWIEIESEYNENVCRIRIKNKNHIEVEEIIHGPNKSFGNWVKEV